MGTNLALFAHSASVWLLGSLCHYLVYQILSAKVAYYFHKFNFQLSFIGISICLVVFVGKIVGFLFAIFKLIKIQAPWFHFFSISL